jgi:hypothetical protein
MTIDGIDDFLTNCRFAGTADGGRSEHQEAIVLRAFAVLLHASLVRFVRDLERLRLARYGSSALKKVPLEGVETAGGNPTASFLLKHLGRTIDEVLTETIRAHVEKRDYPTADQIELALQRIGIWITSLRQQFLRIDQLISCRDCIVHGGPLEWGRGTEHRSNRRLTRAVLLGWVRAVDDLVSAVLLQA